MYVFVVYILSKENNAPVNKIITYIYLNCDYFYFLYRRTAKRDRKKTYNNFTTIFNWRLEI